MSPEATAFLLYQVLFKLDNHGSCIEISRDRFSANRDIALHGWTDTEFRQMAILAGCDYLPSIPKMGVRTAHKHLRKYKTADKASGLNANRAYLIRQVIRFVLMEGSMQVPIDYEKNFRLAELAFMHQKVYDIDERVLVPLSPLTAEDAELAADYIGWYVLTPISDLC